MIRDDVSWSKGTHFFQFGGTYQHNWDYHQRTDNGGGINYNTVYWTGASVGTHERHGHDGLYTRRRNAAWLPTSITGRAIMRIVLGVPGVITDCLHANRSGSDSESAEHTRPMTKALFPSITCISAIPGA